MSNRLNSAAAASVAAIVCLAGAASARPVHYAVTDLGSLPASANCDCFFAEGISENAKVTGFYFGPANEQRGFIWQDGVMTDVGGSPGARHVSFGVNDAGVTAGFGAAFAFHAQNGIITDLPSLGGPFSDALDINNAGVVVGEANTAPSGDQHASMWIGGAAIDLGTLGGELSQALGINDVGQIVGWAWNEERQQRAFIWSEGSGMVELVAPDHAISAEARGVNNLGQAVGSALVPVPDAPEPPDARFRALIWIDGVPTDLGDLGDPDTFGVGAAAINDAGQVVGAVHLTIDISRPFIWENGTMTDPNTLIDPAEGWIIDAVSDINNAGMIAASGRRNDGRVHALLLTPIADCRADFNADGAVDSQDFFAFLGSFFSGAPNADVDGNGRVDSGDFFAFVTLFFEGC